MFSMLACLGSSAVSVRDLLLTRLESPLEVTLFLKKVLLKGLYALFKVTLHAKMAIPNLLQYP